MILSKSKDLAEDVSGQPLSEDIPREPCGQGREEGHQGKPYELNDHEGDYSTIDVNRGYLGWSYTP